MAIKLIILTFFITACASNQSPRHDRPQSKNSNPCSSFKVRLAGNDINLSHKKNLDFGPIHINDTAYASLIFYTNSNDYEANNIVGQITPGKFSFGGSFPGVNPNHGGCGYKLKSEQSCKINLQFSPNAEISYANIFILTFEVKGGLCKQVIDPVSYTHLTLPTNREV